MLKLVIFDIDGTMSDTLDVCIKSFREAVSPYVGHVLSDEEIASLFGLNEVGMIKKILGTNIDDAVSDYFQAYEKMRDALPPVVDGLIDLMEYLKKRGVKLAVITGKTERTCQITLEKLGLQNFFDDVCSGSENENTKGKSISSLMKKYAAAADECFYVGDAVSDVTESQKAGITCLSAAWCATADKDALEKINAGNVFERVSDLRKFFSEQP